MVDFNLNATACRYDKRTQKTVAIKIIDLESAEDEIEDIQQEIQILSQLDSPHVTKYHGSFLKGSHLWIVMECVLVPTIIDHPDLTYCRYCSGGSCSDLVSPARSETALSLINMLR